MDSQVYACNFGANLPCDSKANTDKTPSQAMGDYCKANPDSEFIPMSVTGHTTIYSWHCVKDAAELLEQIAEVDAAGYLAEIWYPIAPGAKPRPETNATQPSMANPASRNCVKQGGRLAIEKRGELGEFGVCYFEDNRQCEEWTLFRGECPVGGLKVTGYITEAARFCAITGGEYAVTGNSGADNEQGTCTFKTGKSCDVWEYYNGTCCPDE
jgi:putative hemolysin